MTTVKLPPLGLHDKNAPKTPLRIVTDSDAGEDFAALNSVIVAKVQAIMARYADNTPAALPPDAYEEVTDLLYRFANPSNRVGHATNDTGPDYPTKWLPDAMLAQLDTAGSLSHGGVGAAMLGCGSAAALPATLLIDGTRRSIPTLWIAMIGRANSAKTPCMDIAFDPYRTWENIKAEQYAALMRAWKKLDRKERDQTPRPVNGSRLSEDATMEMIARRLDNNDGHLALVSDELSGILMGIGQYKKDGGSDKSRMLSLWSGASWTYERVGSNDDGVYIHIGNPVVPVFGTIQPEFTQRLGDAGSGMQGRWMPHYCPPRVGTETGKTAERWEKAVKILLANIKLKRQWTLSAGSESRDAHLRAEERWQDEARDPCQTQASTGFLGKASEHAARAALVLAEIGAAGTLSELPGGTDTIEAGEIPTWAMRAAVDLVDYCAGVWRSLPDTEEALTTSYSEKAVAERDGDLNAWLHGREGGSATKKEIQHAHVAGARDGKAVDALIKRHIAIYGEDAVMAEPRRSVRVFAR